MWRKSKISDVDKMKCYHNKETTPCGGTKAKSSFKNRNSPANNRRLNVRWSLKDNPRCKESYNCWVSSSQDSNKDEVSILPSASSHYSDEDSKDDSTKRECFQNQENTYKEEASGHSASSVKSQHESRKVDCQKDYKEDTSAHSAINLSATLKHESRIDHQKAYKEYASVQSVTSDYPKHESRKVDHQKFYKEDTSGAHSVISATSKYDSRVDYQKGYTEDASVRSTTSDAPKHENRKVDNKKGYNKDTSSHSAILTSKHGSRRNNLQKCYEESNDAPSKADDTLNTENRKVNHKKAYLDDKSANSESSDSECDHLRLTPVEFIPTPYHPTLGYFPMTHGFPGDCSSVLHNYSPLYFDPAQLRFPANVTPFPFVPPQLQMYPGNHPPLFPQQQYYNIPTVECTNNSTKTSEVKINYEGANSIGRLKTKVSHSTFCKPDKLVNCHSGRHVTIKAPQLDHSNYHEATTYVKASISNNSIKSNKGKVNTKIQASHITKPKANCKNKVTKNSPKVTTYIHETEDSCSSHSEHNYTDGNTSRNRKYKAIKNRNKGGSTSNRTNKKRMKCEKLFEEEFKETKKITGNKNKQDKIDIPYSKNSSEEEKSAGSKSKEEKDGLNLVKIESIEKGLKSVEQIENKYNKNLKNVESEVFCDLYIYDPHDHIAQQAESSPVAQVNISDEENQHIVEADKPCSDELKKIIDIQDCYDECVAKAETLQEDLIRAVKRDKTGCGGGKIEQRKRWYTQSLKTIKVKKQEHEKSLEKLGIRKLVDANFEDADNLIEQFKYIPPEPKTCEASSVLHELQNAVQTINESLPLWEFQKINQFMKDYKEKKALSFAPQSMCKPKPKLSVTISKKEVQSDCGNIIKSESQVSIVNATCGDLNNSQSTVAFKQKEHKEAIPKTEVSETLVTVVTNQNSNCPTNKKRKRKMLKYC